MWFIIDSQGCDLRFCSHDTSKYCCAQSFGFQNLNFRSIEQIQADIHVTSFGVCLFGWFLNILVSN